MRGDEGVINGLLLDGKMGSMVPRGMQLLTEVPAWGWPRLVRGVYLYVTLERRGKLIRVARSAQPYPDAATLMSSYEMMLETIHPHVQPRMRLLQDQRLAPGRNDPASEVALQSLRERFLPMFEKRATWVKSSVGKLQVSRLLKEDKLERMGGAGGERDSFGRRKTYFEAKIQRPWRRAPISSLSSRVKAALFTE